MSLESPEGNSLQRLLRASSELIGDFSADINVELAPIVSEVLPESGLLLNEVLNSFSWDGQRFTRQVNMQASIGISEVFLSLTANVVETCHEAQCVSPM